MSDKNLMDPAQNDLIPGDFVEVDIPELAPGYTKPASGIDKIENELRATTVDPCAFDDGLQLRRGSEGGLVVFVNERHIRDLSSLEADELRTIRNYLEGSR